MASFHRPPSGAGAAREAAGHDLFASEASDPVARTDAAGIAAAGSRASMLERQKQLALQRARQRMSESSTISSTEPATAFAPGRTATSRSSLTMASSTAWGASGSSGSAAGTPLPSTGVPAAATPTSSAMWHRAPGAEPGYTSPPGGRPGAGSVDLPETTFLGGQPAYQAGGMRMSGSMPADAVEDYPAKFTPVSTTASTAAYGAGPLSSTAVAYGSAGATGSSTSAPPPALVSSAASIAAGGSGGELGADVSNMPIMPVHDTSVSIRVATPATVDLSDMRRFLTSPLPKSAGILQCTIMRDRSGITNRLYPVYSLYAFEGSQFLMAGRKRGSNKTSNYLVSMDRRDLNRDSTSFLGKVRGNFLGTEFVAYDDGEAPKPSKGLGTFTRTELAFVHYASNVLGSRGPRKMRIAIPKVTPDDRRVVFQPIRDEDGIAEKFKAGHIQDMVLMINKPPKWNEHVGAYVLNFNGRVTMASVKNFQMVSPDAQDSVLLQFGRVSTDEFTMDFQWPLSPLQAFQICLSSFDYKLACE